MKRLFTILTTLALLCAVGCEEQGDDNVNPNDKPNTEQPGDGNEGTDIPDDAYISINKEVLTFSPDGESVDIKVYSNYEWTLTNNCDWVTTSITGGEASDAGVVVTLSADLTYDDREGTITFSCGKAKKLLVVSQSLKEVIIADENNTFSVPAEGGNVSINYQTSIECEVIIPEEAQSWISLAPATRALVNESATLNITENNTGAERSAVVKVVAANNNELFAEYTITQNQRYFMEYTSKDGSTITPYNSSAFGATIIRNEYIDGKGYIEFDAPITSIGELAFDDCTSLTSIIIPDSVTEIGDFAFDDCTSLTSVTIPDSVTEIGDFAFAGCSSLTSVTIPDSVTEIGDYAFFGCESLTSVTIPDSVTEIGGWAFCGCDSLTSVTISDSVTSIGDYTFFGCFSLTSVTIPDSVTSIGDNAFFGCFSLTSVTIPDSVTSIGEAAFAGCSSLTSFYGKYASEDGRCLIVEGTLNSFAPAGLTEYTIPDSVTSIGDYTFFCCFSLTSVTIPDSVTSIGEAAISGCTSLKSIYGKYASSDGRCLIIDGVLHSFAPAGLTEYTISDSVTSIGDYTFYGCSSLTSITIPDSVTTIGSDAFNKCSSLKEVYCKPTTPPTGGSYMFGSNASGRKIYVPTASVEAYKAAEYWSEYAEYIEPYQFE